MDKISGNVRMAKVNGMAQIMLKKRSDFPATGRSSVEYVATDENKIYRYDKAAGEYVCIGTNPDGLQKQIDNIVIAGTGNGDAAAEVVQARVDKSGTTFETLKARLDTMDSETSELNSYLRENQAGFYKFTDTIDGYYVASGGVVTAYEGWSLSGYISCENLSEVSVKMPRTGRWFAFYDADKNVISSKVIQTTELFTISIPDGARYWMVSESNDYIGKIRYKNTLTNYLEELYDTDIINANKNEITTIKEVISASENIFDVSKLVSGYYMNEGVATEYAAWSYTNLIQIDSSKGLNWKWFNDVYEIVDGQIPEVSGNGYIIIDYFDKDKNYISEQTYNYNASKISIPENCCYIVVSSRTNLFVEGYLMMVNSTDIPTAYKSGGMKYDAVIVNKVKGAKKAGKPIRSISRLGYTNGGTIPKQSLAAYKAAYDLGFRIMLCDLQFTSDNIPVCYHDVSLNSSVRNNDGTALTESVVISDKTYDELLNYDIGISFGEAYAGTKVLKFEDMLYWIKKTGLELYVEIKYMNFSQAVIAVDMVRRYGLEDCTSWSCHYRDNEYGQKYQVSWISQLIPTARVALMTDGDGIDGTSGYKEDLLKLQNGINQVFAFNWNTETLKKDEVDWMIAHNIEYEQGTIDSISNLESYFTKGYNMYCTGVESNSIVAHKELLESATEKI